MSTLKKSTKISSKKPQRNVRKVVKKKNTSENATVTMTLAEAIKHSDKLKPGEKTIKALKALKDSDIDYSDIPELTEEFWKNVQLLKPTHKRLMTLRIDDEVIDWFKQYGKGYQSQMNAVLKAYVETCKHLDKKDKETTHLLRSPANAKRLTEATRDIKAGNYQERKLIE